MTHVFFFQYNIPAENQYTGKTDKYINVIAEWDSKNLYLDGKPMVFVSPVNLTFSECISVNDWRAAYTDIRELAESHFAELARIEKINQARAILATEENPVLDRLVINHFTPVS